MKKQKIKLEFTESYIDLKNKYGSVSAKRCLRMVRYSPIIYLMNFLCLKGTWNWAIKMMLKGEVVTTEGAVSVQYRLSKDGQARLQNRFGAHSIWTSSNWFFEYTLDKWVIVSESHESEDAK